MSMQDGLLMEREHGLIHTSSPAIITWKHVVASFHLVVNDFPSSSLPVE